MLDIFVVRDFLDAARMRRADRADRQRPRALAAARADARPRIPHQRELQPRPRRPSRSCWSRRKITALIGIDPAHGETIQGQRYAVGQQFKPHHDFFHKGEAYWPEMERTGGQRTWTAMIFLNDAEGGGQTFFHQGRGQGDAARAATCSPGTISTRSASPIPTRSTRAAGRRRDQIYHHQMVSRAALGLVPTCRPIRPSDALAGCVVAAS